MKQFRLLLLLCSLSISGVATKAYTQPQPLQQTTATPLPQEQIYGNIEPVAQFSDMMPTGVTVAQNGQIFVNFPRWDDSVVFTVAELKNGTPIPHPNATINHFSQTDSSQSFFSVQSVVVDPKNRL